VVPVSVRIEGGGVYISGNGSLVLRPGVAVTCDRPGCVISANLSSNIPLEKGARIVAGWVSLAAASITLDDDVVVDTTALAGTRRTRPAMYLLGRMVMAVGTTAVAPAAT
jgi:hypothetical protein